MKVKLWRGWELGREGEKGLVKEDLAGPASLTGQESSIQCQGCQAGLKDLGSKAITELSPLLPPRHSLNTSSGYLW